MRSLLRYLLFSLPLVFRKTAVALRECWWRARMRAWDQRTYVDFPAVRPGNDQGKSVLVYHIGGLGHGGTEKNLQLIANALAEDRTVFFMYGVAGAEDERKEIMHPSIKFVPFSYDVRESEIPHRVWGMNPCLKQVIAANDIKLLVVASAGYSHYPWNIVRDVPIVMINVFGAPSLQENLVATIFVSHAVRAHAERWVGARPTHRVKYVSLGSEPPTDVRALGAALRDRLGVPREAFVFGRIGRDSDAIFDPIAIRAWKKIAAAKLDAYFVIMSPPPALVDILRREEIPRVICMPPSAKESEVWAFHGALDCFAHFRYDGETSGVAIAESLSVGNPIITHRSPHWNAHLEYLSDECALVAEVGDSVQYARHMASYISMWGGDRSAWQQRCLAAAELGRRSFSPVGYQLYIRNLVRELLPS